MGRIFSIQLSCGCLISLDGGGGLIPCSYEDDSDCKYLEEYLCNPDYVEREVQLFLNNNDNISSNDKEVVAVREQAQRKYEKNLLKKKRKSK